ncbi:MAG: hypothetical protein J2O39_09375, partial [Acidimicrobiales bacterium]|nr:hypothetical protein [Acidimicrobiales bacterium]
MAAHQVFGFVPYWLMGQVSSADLSRLSTVAYFAVSVNGNGTFHQRGGGWADYQSSRLTALVKQSHAAGDRVVLTVNAFDQPTLDQLTQSPEAPYRLARAIAGALIAKSLDGVNLDFEGAGPGDSAGLVTLVTEVSQQLRAVDPGWQITMDTFGSSASDPSGFYDIKDLAPAVDAFFVMAYDMGRPHAVTPTAPLTGPDPNDTQVVDSYLSTVPPSKLLLGIPLYAYAYPTAGALPGARVTGGPVTLTEDQIETEAKQVFWDPATQVAWTAWRGGKQWYQTYFDDPQSVAAKVRLAGRSGLAGVGAWSVGMGKSPAIRNALTLGGATKDWTPRPEPAIGTADSVLASLSPFPLADLSASDLSASDLGGLSSAFADLNSLFGSDFGGLNSGGSDVGGLSRGGGVSGGLSSSQTGGQSTPGSGSPGTASTTSGTSSSGTTAGGSTNSIGGGTTIGGSTTTTTVGTTTTGGSTTTTTVGTTTTTVGTTTTTGGSTTTTMPGGGSGGPSPGGT